MRRGWQTTEFWAAVAVGVGSLAASLSGVLTPRYAAIAAAVATAGYSIARGLAKIGPVPTEPQQPAPPPAEPPPIAAPPAGVS